MEDKPTVIFDCGTCYSRAGLCTDEGQSPRVVIPSLVGRLKCERSQKEGKTVFVGEEAAARRKELNLKLPIEFGHITNWSELQLVYNTLIDRLEIQEYDHPFLLAQTCNAPSLNLENISQFFFEEFGVSSLCLVPSGVLSLLASGVNTGIAVEIGGGACFCVPVVEGYILRHLQQRTEFSGRDLTATMSRMITKKYAADMKEEIDLVTVNSIKEMYCYCAQDYEEECKSFSKEKEIVHTFTDLNDDDRSVSIGMELFQCPESLFQPHLAGKEFPGIHEIVLKCLQVEDDTIKQKLASNIFLCGGSAFFPGLAQRLQKELEILAASHKLNSDIIKVFLSPFRDAAFQGGKVAAANGSHVQYCMSKDFYDENGPYQITKIFRGN